MSVLGPAQKPIVMAHYPHMLMEDAGVWTNFLKAGSVVITRVWYDVRVGSMVFTGPAMDEMTMRIAAGLTRKRIDAILEVEGNTWVVEIKPYANMYAVGQILTYVRLFEQEYSYPGELSAVLLCNDYDEDLIEELEEFGIILITNENPEHIHRVKIT